MSETRKELIERWREKLRKEQAETVSFAQQIQNACSHFRHNGTPLFDVVHNFPDERPRGLCHGCGKLIQPEHWEPAGPDKMRFVSAHHLYPVVEALERADIGSTILQNAETAAVELSLRGGYATLWDLEPIFARARREIVAQLLRDIAPWVPVTTEKK